MEYASRMAAKEVPSIYYTTVFWLMHIHTAVQQP